jgi:hypothetical protein
MRKEDARNALAEMNPQLAQKVQFATGQMSFGFPAGEPTKDHDWRFVGMDVEAGALSRFQCARCGFWMSRKSLGNRTKVHYYAADNPDVFRPLKLRPLCTTRKEDDDA